MTEAVTPAKKPSPAAMLRTIDRLTEQVRTLHVERQKAFKSYGDVLADFVDLKMRAEQAARLLNGEDV